jgi:hypothetical protein
MPEAAVNEDDFAVARQHQIGLAGQALHMQPVTEPHRVH